VHLLLDQPNDASAFFFLIFMSWPSKHQEHRLKPIVVHLSSVTPGFTELSISFIHSLASVEPCWYTTIG